MTTLTPSAQESWYPRPADKTSETDDERIKDITVLPPHLHSAEDDPTLPISIEGSLSPAGLFDHHRDELHRVAHRRPPWWWVEVKRGPCPSPLWGGRHR